jgi:multiple sugar transport system substrate-binding protein
MKRFKLSVAVLLLVVFSEIPAAAANPPAKFDNIEIVIGVQDENAISAPAAAHAQTWQNKTGAKVTIIKMPFGNLFREYLASMKSETPKFDVIFFCSAWAGDFFPYLSEVPKEIAEDESFDDIHDIYKDRLMKWGNKRIDIAIDGDLFMGYYRKDLFEIEQNRKDFKAKYGYDLKSPDTWKQYRDIAEFFTGRTSPDGKSLYGATEVFANKSHQSWFLFSRAAAYTKHPDHKGARFFDPETMKPQIANPGWVRALEDYMEILKFCPPGSLNYRLDDMRKAFYSGSAVLTIEWGDTGTLAEDPKTSAIAGKAGYFMLPGADETWNYKSGKWDKMQGGYKVPFLAFGGWVAGVPANSRKKDAAWNYIVWYGNPQNSLHDVVTAGTGINPYRLSHFMNVDTWTKVLSKTAATEYLGVIRSSLDSPNAALDLRIPGFFEYTEALDTQITLALKKELSAKDALERAAAEWEKITDKYGRDKQLEIYRVSSGLLPKQK